MNITDGPFTGLKIIEPKLFKDDRGYFYESFQQKRYTDNGFPLFVQDNISRSHQHVIRGLHYQLPYAQGKLVYVTRGSVWDVVVDIRLSSKTFGKWFSIVLSDENKLQMFIPPGFAHGFCVLSEEADFFYKCTEYYSPQSEQGVAWDDSTLNINWPSQSPILSPKDLVFSPLHEIPHDKLFT